MILYLVDDNDDMIVKLSVTIVLISIFYCPFYIKKSSHFDQFNSHETTKFSTS